MDVQADISTFAGDSPGGGPNPPSDSELKHEIAPNWLFDFDVNSVEGIDELRRDIRAAELNANTVERWSYILGDHINSSGNKKVASIVDIFNFGTAHDCANIGTAFCNVY